MKVIVLVVLAITQCVLTIPNSEYRGLERDQRRRPFPGSPPDDVLEYQRDTPGRRSNGYREGKANTLPVEPPKTPNSRDGRLLLVSAGDDSLYPYYYGQYPTRRYYTPGDYFIDNTYAAVGKFPYTRKGILSGSNYVYLKNTL